jgi:hypothetical protein
MWGDTQDHFEFEFEIRVVMDRNLQDVTAARLRIVDLQLAPTMDPRRKTELQAQLVGDLIVL